MRRVGDHRLEAINAVLRVAARHVNLLRREAFEELAQTLGKYVACRRLAVVVPDGKEQLLYAASIGDAASPLPPFGARYPLPDEENQRIVMGGQPRICLDTRLGDAVDQLTAKAGYLSYVALPIWARGATSGRGAKGQERPRAKLIVCFQEVGEAGRAPLDLLQEVADVFGAGFERAMTLTRDRRLAMILETSGDAMLAWDSSGRISDANAAASALTGLPRERLLGSSIGELLVPLPTHAVGAEPQRGVRTELRVHRDSGVPLGLPVSVTLTAVEDDPLVAAHALIRDESQVVAAEREAAAHLSRVRELEKELRTLLDNAPLIIFRLDPDTGDLRYLNRHAERTLGVPTEEAMRTPGFLRLAHDGKEAQEAFDTAIQRARLGAISPPYEARVRWRGGAELTVRGTIYPLLSEQGQVVAIEGTLADVSAERAARTRLVQADRLSTLGMLAAGVAHEINNPATFLMLGLERLARELGDGDDTRRELVAELRDSIKRIVDIARDLKSFASPPATEPHHRMIVDVNRAVETGLTLARGQILERARIALDLTPVPPVLMDDGRLGQVIVNLLVNAAQAIPKGGRDHVVTVATRSDGERVEITVSDTGVGIREEHLDRIWTPFFTTKGPDVGTGLGLSISRDIVERAGGTIRVFSPILETDEGGCGTRFVITLPAASGSSVASPSPTRPMALPLPDDQRFRVLIVEDEAPLARALAEEIGRFHEVTVAPDGERALALIAGRAFDVILCDLQMPGMSGEALYTKVCETYEHVNEAFIFMTGVGFGHEVTRFFAESNRPVLEKPFSTERVLEVIAKTARRG